MGCGRRFTEKEKRMVQALTNDKKIVTEITNVTGRSRKAIRDYQRALRFGAQLVKHGLSPKLVTAIIRKHEQVNILREI